MLKFMKGSPNGLDVCLYDVGKQYDVPDELANVFLQNKYAMRVQIEQKKENVPDNKALDRANENKDEGALSKARNVLGKTRQRRRN